MFGLYVVKHKPPVLPAGVENHPNYTRDLTADDTCRGICALTKVSQQPPWSKTAWIPAPPLGIQYSPIDRSTTTTKLSMKFVHAQQYLAGRHPDNQELQTQYGYLLVRARAACLPVSSQIEHFFKTMAVGDHVSRAYARTLYVLAPGGLSSVYPWLDRLGFRLASEDPDDYDVLNQVTTTVRWPVSRAVYEKLRTMGKRMITIRPDRADSYYAFGDVVTSDMPERYFVSAPFTWHSDLHDTDEALAAFKRSFCIGAGPPDVISTYYMIDTLKSKRIEIFESVQFFLLMFIMCLNIVYPIVKNLRTFGSFRRNSRLMQSQN
jgi:hypothetical protein